MAQQAARRAITKLAARPAPSGQLPVVINLRWGGSCFMRHVATASKLTLSAKEHPYLATESVSLLPLLPQLWLTMEPWEWNGEPRGY